MSTVTKFRYDPRAIEVFSPQDGLQWVIANGQSGEPGCIQISGTNDNPTYSLPFYRFGRMGDYEGGGTLSFYINVRDTDTTGNTRFWIYGKEVADGATSSEATTWIAINRTLASGTFRLQARNSAGGTPYVTGVLNRNQWYKISISFAPNGAETFVSGEFFVDDVSYVSGIPMYGHMPSKFAIYNDHAGCDVLIDEIETTTDIVRWPESPELNVCRDTPYGTLAWRDDITLALQWALTNNKVNQRPIRIPCGWYELSEICQTGFEGGGTLLGSGPVYPSYYMTAYGDAPDYRQGAGTLLEYKGTDDGRPRIKVIGTNWEVGNWTMFANNGTYSSAVGFCVGKPVGNVGGGLGTGKVQIRRMRFEGFDKCIQLREPVYDGAENADNLIFEEIEAEDCTTVVHMNSTQVMDIVVNKAHISDCDYMFYVDGGGHLHLEHALFTYGRPCTVLYIPAGADVGNSNGVFRLDGIKVDDQMNSNFTLVHSLNQALHQVHVRGLLCSPNNFVGNFATIKANCYLTIECSSASFKTITGIVGDSGAYTGSRPKCTIYCDNLERPVDEIFSGDIDFRVYSNVAPTNNQMNWRDPDPVLIAANS